MDTFPAELQEKILQKVIQQKVEDKKRMGWDKIDKIICCKACAEHKKGGTDCIKPSNLTTFSCTKCLFNQDKTCGIVFRPESSSVSLFSYPCRGLDAIRSPRKKMKFSLVILDAFVCYFAENDEDKEVALTLVKEAREHLKEIEDLLKKYPFEHFQEIDVDEPEDQI